MLGVEGAGAELAPAGRRWKGIHGVLPALVETYVCDQLMETCYRASNWPCLGQAQARGAWGTAPAKAPTVVFVYPLNRHSRPVLLDP